MKVAIRPRFFLYNLIYCKKDETRYTIDDVINHSRKSFGDPRPLRLTCARPTDRPASSNITHNTYPYLERALRAAAATRVTTAAERRVRIPAIIIITRFRIKTLSPTEGIIILLYSVITDEKKQIRDLDPFVDGGAIRVRSRKTERVRHNVTMQSLRVTRKIPSKDLRPFSGPNATFSGHRFVLSTVRFVLFFSNSVDTRSRFFVTNV